MRVTAVRARYDHISQSWRATPERRGALIGELERLPAGPSDGWDRDNIVSLRADIIEPISVITIGMSDVD